MSWLTCVRAACRFMMARPFRSVVSLRRVATRRTQTAGTLRSERTVAALDAFRGATKLPEGLRFHDLRRGAACLMFAAGADLKTVSVWLGHSTVGITAAIYVHHLNLSMFEDQTKKVDALLRRRALVANA